jgi:hypothetical protein
VKTRLPLRSIKSFILRRRSTHLSNLGIIFTSILPSKGGESSFQRAYISLKHPFLAIHAKGGESISPKQKDRTTTNFKTIVFYLVWSLLIGEVFNWYLILIQFQIHIPSSKLISKTLLNTKRRISLRGSVV